MSACPNGAIQIKDRIAKVDQKNCIGCGLCATACPNKIISIRPATQVYEVYCVSRSNAKETRAVCPNGCVACRMCEKACPSGAIKVENNHAVIDYDLCTNCGECAKACRFGVIKEAE